MERDTCQSNPGRQPLVVDPSVEQLPLVLEPSEEEVWLDDDIDVALHPNLAEPRRPAELSIRPSARPATL
jgi:putative SOS response-associated peptidase YedK